MATAAAPAVDFVIENSNCFCAPHRKEKCASCHCDYTAANAIATTMKANSGWLPGPNPETALKVAKLKEEGNNCFRNKDWEAALKFYTMGLELAYARPVWEPSELVREETSILLCNRAATYLEIERFEEARADAYLVTKLRSNWSKGYFRLGKAMEGLERQVEAIKAYEMGIAHDPTSLEMRSCMAKLMAS